MVSRGETVDTLRRTSPYNRLLQDVRETVSRSTLPLQSGGALGGAGNPRERAAWRGAPPRTGSALAGGHTGQNTASAQRHISAEDTRGCDSGGVTGGAGASKYLSDARSRKKNTALRDISSARTLHGKGTEVRGNMDSPTSFPVQEAQSDAKGQISSAFPHLQVDSPIIRRLLERVAGDVLGNQRKTVGHVGRRSDKNTSPASQQGTSPFSGERCRESRGHDTEAKKPGSRDETNWEMGEGGNSVSFEVWSAMRETTYENLRENGAIRASIAAPPDSINQKVGAAAMAALRRDVEALQQDRTFLSFVAALSDDEERSASEAYGCGSSEDEWDDDGDAGFEASPINLEHFLLTETRLLMEMTTASGYRCEAFSSDIWRNAREAGNLSCEEIDEVRHCWENSDSVQGQIPDDRTTSETRGERTADSSGKSYEHSRRQMFLDYFETVDDSTARSLVEQLCLRAKELVPELGEDFVWECDPQALRGFASLAGPEAREPLLDLAAAVSAFRGCGESGTMAAGADGVAHQQNCAPTSSFCLRIVHDTHRTGFEEAKDIQLYPGCLIGARYMYLRKLGEAAFSTTLECIDTHNKHRVCAKMIKNSKDFLDQSLDEIKVLRYLNAAGDVDEHRVLKLLDYFYYKEHLFIVTELLGDNLYELVVQREGYFNLQRIREIAIQCLEAVRYIHSLGLIHCDLKPENIMEERATSGRGGCNVKVIDFGSSCYTTDRMTPYVQSRSYRAPEVLLGVPYGQPVDIWSLGCIFVELWTGDELFANHSAQSMLARIQSICGPFPRWMLFRGNNVSRYFIGARWLFETATDIEEEDGDGDGECDGKDEGERRAGSLERQRESRDESWEGKLFVLQPKRTSLKHRLRAPQGSHFLTFIRGLLQLDPLKRMTADEALNHAFLRS